MKEGLRNGSTTKLLTALAPKRNLTKPAASHCIKQAGKKAITNRKGQIKIENSMQGSIKKS
jgi:hypothetical protein